MRKGARECSAFTELIREDIANLKKQGEKQKSQQCRQWEKVFSQRKNRHKV